jgi:hypothetical protein
MSDARTYRAYSVFRATGEPAGSVEAQSPEQAVYRLCGGEWGRADFVALSGDDRPLAAAPFTSYRYKGRYGFVHIGAHDVPGALREAERSITGAADPARLEIWSAPALAFVPAPQEA